MKTGIISLLAVSSIYLLLVTSCSSSKKTVVDEPPERRGPEVDESFDPLTLDDEDIVFTENNNESINESSSDLKIKNTENKENQQTDGFRVQLLATKDIESATIEKKEAEFAFVEDSVVVYIEFDSPYYKIRVGDFQNRSKADELKRIARDKGYTTSWIVKTKIWTNPSINDNLRTKN
jgi:hypothetical protein